MNRILPIVLLLALAVSPAAARTEKEINDAAAGASPQELVDLVAEAQANGYEELAAQLEKQAAAGLEQEANALGSADTSKMDAEAFLDRTRDLVDIAGSLRGLGDDARAGRVLDRVDAMTKERSARATGTEADALRKLRQDLGFDPLDRSLAQDCAQQNIYFPLAPGATWTYRGVDESGVHTMTVTFVANSSPSKDAQIDGELRIHMPELEAASEYLTPSVEAVMRPRIQVRDGAVYGGTTPYAGTKSIEGVVLTEKGTYAYGLLLPDLTHLKLGTSMNTPGNLFSGTATWSAPEVTKTDVYSGAATQSGTMHTGTTTIVTPEGSLTYTGSGTETTTATASAIEWVSVPAGKFMALRVDEVTSYFGAFRTSVGFKTWYAPGVGVVKSQMSDGSSLAELVSYNVPPCRGFVVVEADAKASINGKPAEPGMGLSGNSTDPMSVSGSIVIASGTGQRIAIEDGSSLALRTSSDGSGAQAASIVDLIGGKLKVWSNKMLELLDPGGLRRREHEREFEVRTGTVVVGSRATEFSVEVVRKESGPVTIVEVFDGSVWVRKKGETKETVLHAGQKAEF